MQFFVAILSASQVFSLPPWANNEMRPYSLTNDIPVRMIKTKRDGPLIPDIYNGRCGSRSKIY